MGYFFLLFHFHLFVHFQKIKAAIPENIDSFELADLLKPDLSILDTVDSIDDREFDLAKGKEKRSLAKANAMLKRETTLSAFEVEKLINSEVLKQWLPEFVDILSGNIQFADLHIHKAKLTISLIDPRLREIANQAGSNLYLDATIDPLDLNLMLNSQVFIVKQSGDLSMPDIYQVADVGRMTMQRGNEQIRKVKEIVNHLKNIDPSTKVIDFKKFADTTDGNAPVSYTHLTLPTNREV